MVNRIHHSLFPSVYFFVQPLNWKKKKKNIIHTIQSEINQQTSSDSLDSELKHQAMGDVVE